MSAANTTCDIYRAGTTPPAVPAVSNVPCRLEAQFGPALEAGEGDSVATKFTHTLLIDFRIDIRDDYAAGSVGSGADTVYIPDRDGTPFKVVFVDTFLAGVAAGRSKKVYLARKAPVWPSTEL